MESIHLAIYQNLKLLLKVYPNSDMESKLQKNMFKKPNTKGMQSVFYFLISILNNKYCKENIPWPVSFNSDAYKFRVAVTNFIEKECHDFEVPKLLSSHLNKAVGEKYVRFVFSFVTYTTATILENKYNIDAHQKPTSKSGLSEQIILLQSLSNNYYFENECAKANHNNILSQTMQIKIESDNELTEKLKIAQEKQKELHNETKELLSYTNILEVDVIDKVISEKTDDLQEQHRNLRRVQDELLPLLQKTQKIIQLIHLKKIITSHSIDVPKLKLYLTDDFVNCVQVPLPIITTNLFNNDDPPKINLKTFVQLGYVLIKYRKKKFLESEISDKHLNICRTANDIFKNTSKRLDDLVLLDEKLDSLINKFIDKIPDLSTQFNRGLPVNQEVLKLIYYMETFEKNILKDLEPVVKKPVVLEAAFEKGCEDPLLHMRKIKKLMLE